MSRALFLPFALDRAVARRMTPLPFPVAARQIPRLLAEALSDADGSWQVEFLPLVGNDRGRRGFVTFEEPLPLDRMETILGPHPAPDVLVDGSLRAETATLRATAPVTSDVMMELVDAPFDPRDPRILLDRFALELWDLLDLPGRPVAALDVPKDALPYYFVGRDEELALRANLSRMSAQSPFVPFLAGLQRAPGNEKLLGGILELARIVIVEDRGDRSMAARALARAAGNGSCSTAWLESALALARAAGDGRAADELAIPYVQHRPDDVQACLTVGSLMAARGKIGPARDILRRCALAWQAVPQPQGPHILALLIELGDRLGDKRDAERWTRELCALDGIPAQGAEVLARRLRGQDRATSALAVLDKALAAAPEDGGLLLEKGRALLALGEAERARGALEAARAGDELTNAEARRLLRFLDCPDLLADIESAEGRLAEGQPKAACKIASRLVRQARDVPEVWYVLGLARSALGRRRRAVRALRRALQLRPEFPEARNRLGILLVSLGRYSEGYRELARVVDARDEQLGPLLHMAQACYYLRRFDEGVKLLERAEELYPDHPAVVETRSTFYPIDP